jgi:hypothetical protein
MNFQQITLTIAIVILVIMLAFIGVSLSRSKYAESWPPIVGDCPDYWKDLSGNGEACFNVKKFPILEDENIMNFNVPPFNSYDLGTCSKYQWATSRNITWDGITSGIDNPCQATMIE